MRSLNLRERTGRLTTDAVSSFTFGFFIYFTLDFFLRFSARIPGYSAFRPTLIAVAVIFLLLLSQRDKLSDKFKHPVFKPILFLILYILISLPLVEWPGSVIRNNLDPFIKGIVFLFFTALIVDTRLRLFLFIVVFIFCQLVRVLEPLFLNLTQGYWGSATSLSSNEFANRLSGAPADVINPNELGFVIVTLIPLMHYLMWTGHWKIKLAYIFIMPLLFYALILTMSRGAFLALLVVGFFIFKESSKKTLLIVIIVIGSIGAFSVMTPVQKERYLSLVDRDAEGGASAEGRINGMIKEFRLGLTRPIVGHGLGTTPEAKAHKLGQRQASHNLYAELLIETGFIGFFIFIGFMVAIFKQLKEIKAYYMTIEGSNEFLFYNLMRALECLLWMYAFYSLNYWGLSQYYWYLLGGLTIALGRMVASGGLGNDNVDLFKSNSAISFNRFPLASKLRNGNHR